MYSYLDELSLLPGERRALFALAAPTAEALLATIQASPEAFAGLFGDAGRAVEVERRLRELVGPGSRYLGKGAAERWATGARVDTAAPSDLGPPPFDLARRDELFERLQALRARGASQVEIAKVEAELNRLMDAG